MPLSNNINTYGDVRKVFDIAVERGGVKYKLETHKAAVHWRHRAYQFRKLLFKQAERNSIVPGQPAETPYDNLVIRIEDNVVIIQPMELTGELADLNDEPISGVGLGDDDDLLREAEAFKKGLKGMD